MHRGPIGAPTTRSDSVRRIAYGPTPPQVGDLWGPADARRPVVTLIHGGYWRNRYDLDLMTALAADLAGDGWTVWNLEYRRLGDPGGGYPGTFDDVAAGIDRLADLVLEAHPPNDTGGRPGIPTAVETIVVGHSAGGHLALLQAGPTAAKGRVAVIGAVGLGAITDLRAASTAGLSAGAADLLLAATPAEAPERFARYSPVSAPPSVPALLVRGRRDDEVPADQADRLVSATAGGDHPVEMVDTDDDHYTMIRPNSAGWAGCRRWIDRLTSVAPTEGRSDP